MVWSMKLSWRLAFIVKLAFICILKNSVLQQLLDDVFITDNNFSIIMATLFEVPKHSTWEILDIFLNVLEFDAYL